MANDETIHNWKRGARAARSTPPSPDTPSNPAGADELSDADLADVAGGASHSGITETEPFACATVPLCMPPDAVE